MSEPYGKKRYITGPQDDVPTAHPVQNPYSRNMRGRDPVLRDETYNFPQSSRNTPPSDAASKLARKLHGLGSNYRVDASTHMAQPDRTDSPQWPSGEEETETYNSTRTHQQPYYQPGAPSFDTSQRPARPTVPEDQDQGRHQAPSQWYNGQNSTSSRAEDAIEGQQRLTSASTFQDPPPSEYRTQSSSHSRRRGPLVAPPPLSRRGMQSLYSCPSYVSPIPEESFRLHGSGGSNAAVPASWGPIQSEEIHLDSRGTFYDESIHDQDLDHYQSGDDDNLVRSASLGKKGKPSLVVTRNLTATGSGQPRASIHPAQATGQGFQSLEPSERSFTGRSGGASSPVNLPYPTDERNHAVATPEVTMVMEDRATPTVSPVSDVTSKRSSRLAMKRPPQLDLDAVRTAEARGSLTSLPDLIKRATRLAAMIDGGKRPASRVDDLSAFLDEKLSVSDRRATRYRPMSALSDMLNAFPTPADKTKRMTWFNNTSWPRVPERQETLETRDQKQPRRRWCGMPIWVVLVMVFLLLCIIATAIVIPLEIYVFKNLGNDTGKRDVEKCKATLQCQNGGVSYSSQDTCSCICTSGYTGSDCSKQKTATCATTTVTRADGSSTISDVTVGDAIPRLITDESHKFSIPLSGADVLAKFNTANASCEIQNGLVTLSGHSGSDDTGNKKRNFERSGRSAEADAGINSIAVVTVTSSIVVVTSRGESGSKTAVNTEQLAVDTSAAPTGPMVTAGPSKVASAPQEIFTTPPQSDKFNVTSEALDFARVAILYVLQEKDMDSAENAQAQLQNFLTATDKGHEMSKSSAESVRIGIDMTVNLVDLSMNLGDGKIGHAQSGTG